MRCLQIIVCILILSAFVRAEDHVPETERVYLSGRGRTTAVPWRFQCTSGAKSGSWTQLPVPSHWDVHGFGSLNYRKDSPAAQDEHGLYQHQFTAEKSWADHRVFLVFEGVMTDATVRLNGQQLGPPHQGAFYRFKYEITDVLRHGRENLLEVDVAKYSANDSVNQAERKGDYWLFGGIFRPVYLEILPQVFVDRVAVDARANGRLSAEVFINGKADSLFVQAQILRASPSPPVRVPVRNKHAQVDTKFHGIQPWSAESPQLYSLVLTLVSGETPLHRVQQRVGFRTIEVREGDGIYLNNQRIILKGINRHSSWPESGRCLCRDDHQRDIDTIKAMNMNAVRMSHYPPDAEFLDLCDEQGLYVLNELAGWHWHYDTEVGSKLVREMVTRDVNHPCILFWNNGNEGGTNSELDPLFAAYDPQQRRVLHPWEEFNGINASHYLEYPRAKLASAGTATRHGTGKKFEEWDDVDDPEKYIYMPTEMMHGLYDGGGGAGFEDYWELMRSSPLLGGGFFWVFADEGIIDPETGELDCAGNQAPDGVVGPYREREGSFYTIKELWSPIQVKRISEDEFAVHNHYSFTNAKFCRYVIEGFRLPTVGSKTAPQSVFRKQAALPSIPPADTKVLSVSLPTKEFDLLTLKVEDQQQRELWTWSWMNDNGNQSNDDPAAVQPTVTQTERHLVVTSGALNLHFQRETGWLDHVQRGSTTLAFGNGPRVPRVDSKLQSFGHTANERTVVLNAKYKGPLQSVKWTIRDNGWATCEYRYRADGEVAYHGVVFDYPQDKVISKRWLGYGPFRVWKNRVRGGRLGLWQNEYNATITGYSEREYPEFKGCFQNVSWMTLDTDEMPITLAPSQETPVYVQVLTPDMPPDELIANTKVELPECGLGLLHAIPPMGSKFKHHSTTGPQGQLNQAKGTYGGKVHFYFGNVPVSPAP